MHEKRPMWSSITHCASSLNLNGGMSNVKLRCKQRCGMYHSHFRRYLQQLQNNFVKRDSRSFIEIGCLVPYCGEACGHLRLICFLCRDMVKIGKRRPNIARLPEADSLI